MVAGTFLSQPGMAKFHEAPSGGRRLAGGLEGLQVVRGEASVLGDAGQHAGTDLFAIVEREDEVGTVGMGENPVGACRSPA
jgi:hypothetical protein